MMKLRKVMFLTALVVVFVGCTKQKKYNTISQYGISFEYPSEWKNLEVDGYLIVVMERAKTSKMAVLCNFVVETDVKFNTIEGYIVDFNKKMESIENQKDWKVISDRIINLKGLVGREIISTCSTAGFKSKSKSIFIKPGEKVLNINTTSSITDYESNKVITDRIFNSIRFENE